MFRLFSKGISSYQTHEASKETADRSATSYASSKLFVAYKQKKKLTDHDYIS